MARSVTLYLLGIVPSPGDVYQFLITDTYEKALAYKQNYDRNMFTLPSNIDRSNITEAGEFFYNRDWRIDLVEIEVSDNFTKDIPLIPIRGECTEVSTLRVSPTHVSRSKKNDNVIVYIDEFYYEGLMNGC